MQLALLSPSIPLFWHYMMILLYACPRFLLPLILHALLPPTLAACVLLSCLFLSCRCKHFANPMHHFVTDHSGLGATRANRGCMAVPGGGGGGATNCSVWLNLAASHFAGSRGRCRGLPHCSEMALRGCVAGRAAGVWNSLKQAAASTAAGLPLAHPMRAARAAPGAAGQAVCMGITSEVAAQGGAGPS